MLLQPVCTSAGDLAAGATSTGVDRPTVAPPRPRKVSHGMSRTYAAVHCAVALLAWALSACAPLLPARPRELVLEEHPLDGPPALEPLTFAPVEDTQEAVLARHAQARAHGFPNASEFDGSNPAIVSVGEDRGLRAVMLTSTTLPPEQTVSVLRGDETLFTAPVGLPSPLLPMQGLWTYAGHWAIELVYVDPDVWQGRIYVDGELLNSANGYDEAFGLQLLGGQPFFFYERQGRIGYAFGGEEVDLGFDQVPHYRCCSESVLNPVQAQSMVAFFGRRGSEWSYVELGLFDP